MRFHVLACDYDGTLAHDGHVDAPTITALERVLDAGRTIILVTGRQLPELLTIFPEVRLFQRVVAENGAVLYRPDTGEQRLLAAAPPASFLQALQRRGIQPSLGHVVVATWRPDAAAVHEAIRESGLDWQIIFNKDAVMALPSGVNKASGLAAVLAELGQSPAATVGIGDAENDGAMLDLCGCGVAVANALPALKDLADWVTQGGHGAGVVELIDRLIADDLHGLARADDPEPQINVHA